jgi:hypothetical protein
MMKVAPHQLYPKSLVEGLTSSLGWRIPSVFQQTNLLFLIHTKNDLINNY